MEKTFLPAFHSPFYKSLSRQAQGAWVGMPGNCIAEEWVTRWSESAEQSPML